MAASIHTNSASNALYSAFNKSNQDLQKSLQQVGTGYRVSSAKDDAASSSIASGLSAELGGFEKAHLNTSQAMSLLKTMESGIDQLESMVQRMQSLTIQSQSSALTSKNKATMQNEVAGLLEQMGKVVSTTNFNGVSLLSGNTATTAYSPFTTQGATPPASNVFATGLTYSFDSSVDSSAIEVTYTAGTRCSGGTFYMNNLETGAYQEIEVQSPVAGSNSYYFDQLGATITITEAFDDTADFSYAANTSNSSKILANSSGDINCMGVTTQNNNIAITQTTGQINDISSKVVTISGTTNKSATFTLPAYQSSTGETNGNFVAHNIDLSTTGTKEIVLSRTQGTGKTATTDSITLQLTVTSAFTTTEVSAATQTVTLSQLQNIVIAESSSSDTSSLLSFQVNTMAVGSDSDNKYSIHKPSLSITSLGLDSIDLTSTTAGSNNLNKIRNALSNLDKQRAQVGVAQSLMEIAQNNLEVSMENTTAARSSLIDLDFAKGVLELTNATVRQQAAQGAMVRANGTQNQLLQLLQGDRKSVV